MTLLASQRGEIVSNISNVGEVYNKIIIIANGSSEFHASNALEFVFCWSQWTVIKVRRRMMKSAQTHSHRFLARRCIELCRAWDNEHVYRFCGFRHRRWGCRQVSTKTCRCERESDMIGHIAASGIDEKNDNWNIMMISTVIRISRIPRLQYI